MNEKFQKEIRGAKVEIWRGKEIEVVCSLNSFSLQELAHLNS